MVGVGAGRQLDYDVRMSRFDRASVCGITFAWLACSPAHDAPRPVAAPAPAPAPTAVAATPVASATASATVATSPPAPRNCKPPSVHPAVGVRRLPNEYAHVQGTEVDLSVLLLEVEDPTIAKVFEGMRTRARGYLKTEKAKCIQAEKVYQNCLKHGPPGGCHIARPKCDYGVSCELAHNDGHLFVANCEEWKGALFDAIKRTVAFARGANGFAPLAAKDVEPHRPCNAATLSWGPRPKRKACAIPKPDKPVRVIERPVKLASRGAGFIGKIVHVPAIPDLRRVIADDRDSHWRFARNMVAEGRFDCRRAGENCEFTFNCAVTKNDGNLLSGRCIFIGKGRTNIHSTRGFTYRREAKGWRRLTSRELFLRAESLETTPELAATVHTQIRKGIAWDKADAFHLTDDHIVFSEFRPTFKRKVPRASWKAWKDELACSYHELLAGSR